MNAKVEFIIHSTNFFLKKHTNKMYTSDYLQDKTGLRLQTNPEAVLQTRQNRLQSVLQSTITIDQVLDGGNVVKCGNIIVMTEKVFAENRGKSPDFTRRSNSTNNVPINHPKQKKRSRWQRHFQKRSTILSKKL